MFVANCGKAFISLHPVPVVIRLPIAREFAHRRELRALDRFPLRPLRRCDPPAQTSESVIGRMKLERHDRSVATWQRGSRPASVGAARASSGRGRWRRPWYAS